MSANGVWRLRGFGGEDDWVIVDVEGEESFMPAAQYRLAGTPHFERLKWFMLARAASDGDEADDFESARDPDAIITGFEAPNRSEQARIKSGWLQINWRRRFSVDDLKRYAAGAGAPSWIEEFEAIAAPDIVAVSRALTDAKPANEAELSEVLKLFPNIVRNYRVDRR